MTNEGETHMNETIAAAILQRAIDTGRAGELLEKLFDGASVTLDPSGELVYLEADMIARMLGGGS